VNIGRELSHIKKIKKHSIIYIVILY